MLAKTIIVIALFGVITAMGFAMYFLMQDNGPKKRTVNALAVRVGLSISIIVFLVVAYRFGWIEPHGVVP